MLKNSLEADVIELRKLNKGYGYIAKELNLTKSKVKYICRKHKLNGVMSERTNQYGTLEERENIFQRKFESRYSDFKYHSDFVNVDSHFKSKCKKCGYIEERHAQCIRHDHSNINCTRCGLILKLTKSIRLKISQCEEMERNNLRLKIQEEVADLYNIKNNHKYFFKCKNCNRFYFTHLSGKKFCCTNCANKFHNRKKELRRRKRILENGDVDYDITLDKLAHRDGMTCHICGEKVDWNDYNTLEGCFYVGYSYPSIDHVVPISKGGRHVWANVKLAHHHCNTLKSNMV